ncbi:MAG: hypothetical protein ACKVU0_14705 [Saprospiraceae bacterium]
MKRLLIFLALWSLQISLSAQKTCDTILLKSGKTILAEIEKSTGKEIFYQICGDNNKGQRSISISFIKEIRSQGGNKNLSDLSVQPAISDTTKKWRIVTKDDNNYFGVIVKQDASQVVIRTDLLGEVAIPKSQIVVMEPIKKEQMVDGEFWYKNPHNTRYFFAPNGYGLQAGEGYYQNTWIFLNQVTYGFTDNFSMGVGLIPTFLFGASGFPFWITPKISLPLKKDNLNVGAGVLYANAVGLGFDNEGGAGIAYGVLTAGSPDRNFTLGLGYGFAGGRWADYPAVTLSGMYRVSKKFTFLTENYLIPAGGGDNFGLISVGGRFGGKNLALDFGLFRPLFGGDNSGFWALPWLGINVPFGKAR